MFCGAWAKFEKPIQKKNMFSIWNFSIFIVSLTVSLTVSLSVSFNAILLVPSAAADRSSG